MMIYIGAFIALQVIVLVAYWLMKKNNPQGVLIGLPRPEIPPDL